MALPRNDRRSLILLIAAATWIAGSCDRNSPSKIIVTPDMVINEVAKGDATMLVDEQGTSGDFPVHTPSTQWTVKVPVGETGWYLPANAVIDLQREYVINEIFLFHGDGPSGICRINYGTPFQWISLLEDSIGGDNTWSRHTVDIKTRHLQISKVTDSDLREIILYGYPTGERRTENKNETRRRSVVVIDEAVGINTHYQDPFERVKVAGIAREYHNWILNEGGFTRNYPAYPQNAIQWNPASPMQKEKQPVPPWDEGAGGGFDFDTYYRKFRDAGITVFPCVQGTVPWLSGEPNTKSRHKPVPQGKDAADPLSYMEHADFMFQYAARYGSAQVDQDFLKAAPGQRKLSGLGYLEYYENWNEPDGWWGGRRDYFTPYEYAAMSSADYDGHESRMGKDKGIKNADPHAKLVMSGIAIPNVDYLRAMKFWFDYNRKDRRFVFDVITVHHYCNAKGSQAEMTKGISPERDGLKGIVARVAAFRDEVAPDREVWITEFGWDTNPATPQSAPSEEMQGYWLVRAYLECFAAGVDRVMMYMLRDVDPESHIQFSSSGLIGPLGNFRVKPSWFYVYTLRNQLAGFVFDRELESGNEMVRIYQFREPQGKQLVQVMWCADDRQTIDDFEWEIPSTARSATVVSLSKGQVNGKARTAEIIGGKIKVDLSPSPVFINIH